MNDISLVEVGQRLAEARESQNITLEQAEKETRIRLKYLLAMEAGDFDALPNDVVERGFLRSYAQYLGLDPAPLIAAFNAARPEPVSPIQAPERERGPHVLDMDLGRRATGGAATFLSGLLVLILIGVAGFWLWQQGRLPLPTAATATPAGLSDAGSTATPRVVPSPTPEPPTPPPTPTARPTSAQAASPTTPTARAATPAPTATPTSTPTPTLTPTATPTPLQEVVVEATLTDRTWLRIKVDGDTVLEGLFEPERTFTWRGKAVEIRTGNAAGIQLVVNGEDLGAMGAEGEVVHWIFRVEDGTLAKVTPTPTPTPAPDTGQQETP